MKGTHHYKRRTYDEARELAMAAVRDQIRDHLPASIIEEMRGVAIQTGGGGPGIDDWTSLVGSLPDPRMHYEFQVYEPSDEHPYIKRYFFRALASRDRAVDAVWIMWLPPVPEYPPLPSEPKHDIPEGNVLLHD
jgi:hypothetical protein